MRRIKAHNCACAFVTIAVAAGACSHAWAQGVKVNIDLPQDNSATNGQWFGDEILLSSDSIITQPETNTVEAIGNVQAFNKGRRLKSDRLIYNRENGAVTASGNVLMIEPDGTTSFAQSILVDDRLSSGVIDNFSSRLANGGLLAAQNVIKRPNNRNSLSHVIYTACPICEDQNKSPTWELRAASATQDQKTKIILYRDVIFNIKGVPVFYTPVFSTSDPSAGRQTGFLQPNPGRTSRIGYYLETPFLYVLDDYSDVIISPLFSQYANPLLSLEYRRNFYSGKLRLSGSITEERLFGGSHTFYGEQKWRGHIFGDGLFKINDVWKWGFGLESVSDDLYLSRYSIHGQNTSRGIFRTTNTDLINQLYFIGQKDNFFFRAYGLAFRDLTGVITRKEEPRIIPAFEAMNYWNLGPMNGMLNVVLNGAYLDAANSLSQSTGRISGLLRWNGQTIIGNGLIIEPNLNIRGDYYTYNHYRNTASNQDYSRALGTASIDFRWPLQRAFKEFNLILEPKLNLTYSSTDSLRNKILNQDSIGYDNNFNSYFGNDSISNFDLWDEGARATIGVNFGATNNNNTSINWFVGKQYRADTNPFLDRLSNVDRENGDWVSNVNLNLGTHITLEGNVRLDGKTMELARTEVAARLSYWGANLSVRYHELPYRIGGADFANRELVTRFSYKIGDKTTLFADNWYDYRSKDNLRTRIGAQFGDDCTDVRVYYEENNTTNRFVTPSSGFKIQVAFKTIGVLNEDSFE